MASIDSNLPSIQAAVASLVDAIAFDSAGEDQSLGRDALADVALAIADRTVADQRDPDGAGLKPLAESTKRRKAKLGQPDLIGVATGEMLSLEQLKGEQTIAADSAEMAYGSNDHARDKAGWFKDGDREFYALGDAGIDAVMSRLEEHLERVLESF